jgi:FkbM family methyltransferase
MSFVSYAQNFEDVMLWRALGHITNGFYIDIGAQDPVVDSVSLVFYNNGWRGVHVEPSVQYATRLRQFRPGEVVEECAISGLSGSASLYVIPDTGLSTVDSSIAEFHTNRGFFSSPLTVPVMALDMLLEKHKGRDIQWMKIDVEGLEFDVLSSWRVSEVRPWILVIESTLPMTQDQCHELWEEMVLSKGYQFVYFDGLNRFYVHHSHSELQASFGVPPNVFDNFTLSGDASNSMCSLLKLRVEEKQQRISEQERRLSELDSTILELQLDNKTMVKNNNELNATNYELNQKLAEVRASLSHIENSRTWRFTRPVRSMMKLFEGQGMSRFWAHLMAFVRSRLRLLLSHMIAYLRNSPKVRALGLHLLRRVGLHSFVKSKYQRFTAARRIAEEIPVDIAELGPRATEIYNNILRQRNRY